MKTIPIDEDAAWVILTALAVAFEEGVGIAAYDHCPQLGEYNAALQGLIHELRKLYPDIVAEVEAAYPGEAIFD